MDRTYDRNLPVSSLIMSRVSCIYIKWTIFSFLFICCKLDFSWHTVFCFSLWTTYHPGKKLIKQSTTFTSNQISFLHLLHLCQMSAAAFGFCGTSLCVFVGLNCLFGLSVLVYIQSHALLCSGQLQTFPVYSFLWNLHPFLWWQDLVCFPTAL